MNLKTGLRAALPALLAVLAPITAADGGGRRAQDGELVALGLPATARAGEDV